MSGWYTHDVKEEHVRCQDGTHMMSRRNTCDVRMVHTCCQGETRVMSGWYTHNVKEEHM